MPGLETERLRLWPHTLRQLQRWLRGQWDLVDLPDAALAPDVVNYVVLRAISAKAEKMGRARADTHLWYTYWGMVRKSDGLIIGLAGFKGAPDAQGEVELGYGVAPAYQGQGFMTEAARALVAWALAQPGCRGVRALTLPTNLASQRVLEKAGLVLVQQRDGTLTWRVHRRGGGETAV